ncbi:MAG: leucine-rich repeat protein, partial [Verrucomicrobiales bacterium]|nr:leucine-rich repeat protein [Verrucomicrobiales bacterium]
MACLAAVECNLLAQRSGPQNAIKLNVHWDNSKLEAQWPAQVFRTDGTPALPIFELQRSTDLNTWSSLDGSFHGNGEPNGLLSAPLPMNGSEAFYRLLARFSSEPPTGSLAKSGAEVFGYANSLREKLAEIGQITPDQFGALYPVPTNYLAAINWDPTTADFWPEFNVDPEEYNLDLIRGLDDLRDFDFRLNTNELVAFKKNGFVVSERLGAPSCGEIFSRLWEDDLPVFIATDPLLYAWHRSYDMMLAELEETYLFENVRQMLDGMDSKVAEAAGQAGNGPLNDSVRDADYFVTIARSLLAGSKKPSSLAQDDRVAATLLAITQSKPVDCFDLFGAPRTVDFSQFKPRGHYTESERLGRYFQCVMWLGRTDLRVAGGPYQDSSCEPPHDAPPRELGTAIVLNQLLNRSGQFERWQQFDHLIQTFVGWTDSMTFAQLGELLHAAGIQSIADVKDSAALQSLQTQLVKGTIGVKNIRSDWFNSPLGPEQIQLPQSFTVFGQKFILDSWGLSQSVFDSIVWDKDGTLTNEDKVPRRVPSALDVAFSIFGNDQVVPELIARIEDQSPTRHIYRDGYYYQHNLAAVRAVVDDHPDAAWNQNLYMGWLATLRELSAPATDSGYPDALRTRAWAMKDLNAQLTSWTQMRHDTVLYAEQSYTGCGDCACSYPDGFVEPRSAFWRRLRIMSDNAVELIRNTDFTGTFQIESPRGSGAMIETNLQSLQIREIACFQRFSEVATTLLDMSERELRQEPFTQQQSDFLQNTMVAQFLRGYGSWWEVYAGWYPKLFYRPLSQEMIPNLPPESISRAEADFQFQSGALKWDAIVTDVHTDVRCPTCDPVPDP